MLRERKPIGTIGVIRERPGRFSDAQVELLRTFADQAVTPSRMCALFTELEARNTELTDALARQTATAEVLSVSKRPRHHRGPRNHYPEAPMTPVRRSHRRDGSAAVQRVGLFPAEPFDNAVAVVVQRQRHRHGNGREQDHLEVVARLGPSTLR
jgi:hypothetical protein